MIKAEIKNDSLVLTVFGNDIEILKGVKTLSVISSALGLDKTSGRKAWIIKASLGDSAPSSNSEELLVALEDLKTERAKLKKELAAAKREIAKLKKDSEQEDSNLEESPID